MLFETVHAAIYARKAWYHLCYCCKAVQSEQATLSMSKRQEQMVRMVCTSWGVLAICICNFKHIRVLYLCWKYKNWRVLFGIKKNSLSTWSGRYFCLSLFWSCITMWLWFQVFPLLSSFTPWFWCQNTGTFLRPRRIFQYRAEWQVVNLKPRVVANRYY